MTTEETKPMTTVLDSAPPKRGSVNSSSWGVLYTGTLVLGAIASFAFLGRNSLYLDETVSTTLARTSWHRFTQLAVHRESNMALYYLILRGWAVLGRSEVAVRSLSVLASIGALAVLILLTRELFGRRAALVCGLILAIDPLVVEFAQDARGYALSLLLVSASSALFVRGVRRDSTWLTWGGYVVLSALAAYSNYWAVLVPVAHACSLAFLPRRSVPWRPLLRAAIVLVVLLVPLGLMIHANDSAGVNWAAGTSAGRVFSAVRSKVPHVVIDLGLVVIIAVVVSLVVLLKRRRPAMVSGQWPLAFTLCWLVVPLALVVSLSFAYKPLLVLRYLVVCLPPMAMLAGAGLGHLHLRLRSMGLALVIAGSGVGLWYWYAHGAGEDWRGAVAAVADRSAPDDGVMVFAPYMRIPFEWYLQDHPVGERDLHAVYPDLGWNIDPMRFDSNIVESSTGISRASRQYHRIWLVLSAAQLYPEQEHEVLSGLRSAGFSARRSLSFPGIEVTEYLPSASASAR